MTVTDIIKGLIIILSICVILTEGSNPFVNSLKDLRGKPKAKAIKTKFGDIYDCIDFYKQPSVRHLQLQNYHEYHAEMRPSFTPKRTTTTNIMASKVESETTQVYQLEDGGCPLGTVPIRRLSKDDHIQVSNSSRIRMHSKLSSNPVQPRPGTHLAILQTKSSPSPTNYYYGVGANISIWNPQVKENQYSAAQITISNGRESLQAGWMVGESDCYNTHCPGFVQVRKDLPVDGIITIKPRRPGLAQGTLSYLVYRDPPTGHWWLLVTEKNIPIGFWPTNILKDMSKVGTYVSCGGETYSPPDQPGGLPPMGNGAFPIRTPILDAYAKDFSVVDDKNMLQDAQDVERFMDSEKYYIDDLGIVKDNWGHVLCFGGYGG